MIKQIKLIFFLTLITVMAAMVFGEKTASGGMFTPPVPDKNKVLPANDGGPEGCDSSRFECVMEGAGILDKQTELIWARDTELLQKGVPWEEAISLCQNIEIGGKKGWRLPTRDELIAILDTSQSRPALPEGHPFTKIRVMEYGGKGDYDYWTSTEYEGNSNNAWLVHMSVGRVLDDLKIFDHLIGPVRDSN